MVVGIWMDQAATAAPQWTGKLEFGYSEQSDGRQKGDGRQQGDGSEKRSCSDRLGAR
ncbi:hypothetical protein [Stieleria varia]|uniref:hypothetical protein n=1 Tax=Stieleria varia TaxID=2528005 RepID=UPI0018D22539|nr:hypothetical protein [Stieleria varia]